MFLLVVKHQHGNILSRLDFIRDFTGVLIINIGNHDRRRTVGDKFLLHAVKSPSGFRRIRQIRGQCVFNLYPVHCKD